MQKATRSLLSVVTSEPVTLEIVDIFSTPDFETHATVADLLSPAHVLWCKTLSFSILP